MSVSQWSEPQRQGGCVWRVVTLARRCRAVGAVLLLGLVGCSTEEPATTARPAVEETGPGWWNPRRTTADDADSRRREAAERLTTLGYVGGSVEPDADRVITVHSPERVQHGLNFYTSGHAPEALLMDLHGNELHRWNYTFASVWPDAPVDRIPAQSRDWWRRAYLYENGDILAIFEGVGLIKLDRDSNLLWASRVPAHHDLEVMPDGTIYVLTREIRVVPSVHEKLPTVEDFVALLDERGNTVKRVSLLRCFENSGFEFRTPPGRQHHPDIFHTNTLEVLDGRIAGRVAAFKRGNVLVSMRTLDRIAVVDLDQEKVVWTHTAEFKKQHDPKVLGNGNLLLYDNLGRPDQSAVIELDPLTLEIVWEYRGRPEQPFFSAWSGTADRLPNGNTLITESDFGRAFEVTPDKQIVWEFHNPHRAGENDRFIATLLELVRLPPDFPVDWARSAPGGATAASAGAS